MWCCSGRDGFTALNTFVRQDEGISVCVCDMASIESLTMWFLLAMLALQSAALMTRDDSPRELFSEYPPTSVPRLVAAEHNKLHFVINIVCTLCPDAVWEYKAEEERNWTRRNVSCSHYERGTFINVLNSMAPPDSCKIPFSFDNLNASSTYFVRSMLTLPLWYTDPPSEPVRAVTCSTNVAAIEDLQVYSAGSSWVVISWLPPTSLCHTILQYEVRVLPVLLYNQYEYESIFEQKGIFWSDFPWTVQTPIMSCISWPNRHCLLIQRDSTMFNQRGSTMRSLKSNREYQIDVRVKRLYNEENSKIITIKANTTTLYIPSPPTELYCKWTLSEGLELHWHAPLRPGGVLTTAHVRITHGHDRPLYERHMNISSVVNYTYVYRVNVTLEEDQRYNVFVCFCTSSNKCGEEAHVAVWRPPSKSNVTSLTIASLTKRKDDIVTEAINGESVTETIMTETINEENVTEAITTETMDEKNVIETITTETMDEKNLIEAITTMTEAMDGKNATKAITIMTEAMDGKNVTNRDDNMTDVVIKETVIAYGGGNVLWGILLMMFMSLLVVGVFLAGRRWGSRWRLACLSRNADQLATPTNTSSIQESTLQVFRNQEYNVKVE